MVRLGWQRFVVLSLAATIVAVPFGNDAVAIVFFVVGLAAIVGLLQAARHYRPPDARVWDLIAVIIALFLLGGIAEALTAGEQHGPSVYPGWREPFDLIAYVTMAYVVDRMARARLARRDRTIVLDAAIGMGGVGALAWVGVMSTYLESTQLTTLGKVTGIAFTVASLAVGFMIVRLAIGPGARPTAYYFLAVAAAGSFIAELFIELELSGRAVPGFEVASLLTSLLAVVMVTAAALHPSMVELTEPPSEATPRMTAKRLVAMSVAVLIPPALLLPETVQSDRYETIAVIGFWAALSILVMIRVFSLARIRERSADIDRALANADAALLEAGTREQMVDVVIDAAPEIVSRIHAVAVHRWADGWQAMGAMGRSELSPLSSAPLRSRAEQSQTGDGYQFDVHFTAVDLTGVVSIGRTDPPDSFQLSRMSALVADLARAFESLSLGEEAGRQRSERRFRALIDNSADIIVVTDVDRTVQYVSPAGPRLLGYPECELLSSDLRQFVVDDDRSLLDAAIASPGGSGVELRMATSGGAIRWFELRVADMIAEQEIQGLVVTASEISIQKQAQVDLQRSEARFRSLVQHASDLVAVLEPDGFITWISPSSWAILGVEPSGVVEQVVSDFTHPAEREAIGELLAQASAGSERATGEFRFRDAGGGWRILDVIVTNLLADPSVEGLVLNAHDVTERKNLERNLRHQALHDDLTGIPNRVLFQQRVAEELEHSGKQLAVMVADLDDFKTVNDGLGHSVGDDLLKVLATRLTAALRSPDLASRLGGDEFAVMISNGSEPGPVMAIARRIRAAIEEPIQVAGREMALRASIGVAFASDVDDPTPEKMLRNADLAMYGAKNRGKSRVVVFDESMHEGAFERLELKADLARALDSGELLLHYQPVMNLSTGFISGFEALMRWDHRDRGMVGPGTFIPLAEETGLIVPIGRWLVSEALDQLRSWQARFPRWPPLTMAVNVSGRQLEDAGIAGDISSAIDRAGVDPSTVVVELTESVVVEDSADLVERLDTIRAIGVGLYADDFGAGFASYSALQSLPFSGVKIDRSLVNGLEGRQRVRAEAQVRSIIEMAATTEMRVVAEGVESAAQARALRRMRCETAQGFYFARPAAASSIEQELERREAFAEHGT